MAISNMKSSPQWLFGSGSVIAPAPQLRYLH